MKFNFFQILPRVKILVATALHKVPGQPNVKTIFLRINKVNHRNRTFMEEII